MNKRKVTKSKGSKLKVDNDPSEVFVLPPNLLEKLGINLGSIGSTPEFTMDCLVTDKKNNYKAIDICQEKHIVCNAPDTYVKPPSQNESTIIETANLMKESVFLSPTFISHNTCAIQGEVEIVGTADIKTTRIAEINLHKKDDFDIYSNEMRVDVTLDTQEISVSKNDSQIPDNAIILENIEKENMSAPEKVDNIVNSTPIEDHEDEAYASDCSISNKGGIEKTDKLNTSNLFQGCGKNNIKNKKINIISEQILDPAQLRKLICHAPNGKSLVPVTVDTLLKSQYRNNIVHENRIDLSFIPDLSENSIDEESVEHTKQNCVTQNLVTEEDINTNIKLRKVVETPENNTSDDCHNSLLKANYETFIVTQHVKDICAEELTSIPINEVQYKNDPDTSVVISSNTGIQDNSCKSKTTMLHETCVNSFANKSDCGENEVKATLEMLNTNDNNVNKSDTYNNRSKTSTDLQKSKCSLKDNEKSNLKDSEIAFYPKNTEINCVISDRSSQNVCEKPGFQSHNKNNKFKKKMRRSGEFSHVKPKIESQSQNVASFEQNNQINIPKSHIPKYDNLQSEEIQIAMIGTPNKIKSHHDLKLFKVETATDLQEDKIREIAKYLSLFADIQRRKSNDNKHNRKQAHNSKLSIQGVEKPGGKNKINTSRNLGNIKTYLRKQKKAPTNQTKTNKPPYFDKYNKKIDLVIQPNRRLINLCNEHEFCMCDDFGRMVSYENGGQHEHIHFWEENKIDCTSDVVYSIYYEDGPVATYADNEVDMAIDNNEYISNAISLRTYRKLCWNEINTSGDTSPVRDNNSDDRVHISYNGNTKNVSREIKTNHLNEEVPTKIYVCNTQTTSIQRDNNVLTIDPAKNYDGGLTSTKVNLELDKDPTRNGKKRKWSTRNECEEPPVKKKYKSTGIETTSTVESEKITNESSFVQEQHTVTVLADDEVGAEQPSSSKATIAICGVCRQDVENTDWLQHIASKHNYMSWKLSELPLDLENREIVVQHLTNIVKQIGLLICNKCGLTRKYAKSFLNHAKVCNLDEICQHDNTLNDSSLNASVVESVKQEIESVDDVANDCIICGVCGTSLQNKDWNSHIETEHNYLAWISGEPTLDLDDEDAVKQHLYAITKERGGLRCSKCGCVRKYVKSYLTHFKICDGLSESHNESALNTISDLSGLGSARSGHLPGNDVDGETAAPVEAALATCGVCGETMPSEHWNSHRELKHDYLAWQCGEQALDIADEEAVKDHLYDITKAQGGLNCSKCGLTRKYVKSYMTHLKRCNGSRESQNDSALDASVVESVSQEISAINSVSVETEAAAGDSPSRCGVCGEAVGDEEWSSHREERHHYLAWKCGEPVLDVQDETAVKEHLLMISKECGGLKCAKCGLKRKYATSYLAHVDRCNGRESEDENSSMKREPVGKCNGALEPSTAASLVQCGVCGEDMALSDWMAHNTNKHDYLAWKQGENPVNVNKRKEVYHHLCKVIKECGALYCQKCGKKRKVVKNYLDHIKLCGQDVCTTIDSTFEADSTLDIDESGIDIESGGTCGVCHSEVQPGKWIQHIQKQHNYLAWRQDEKPWDLDNFTEVNENLLIIAKKMDGLTCNKCGLVRKYVKAYLTHIKNCNVVDFNINSSAIEGIGPASLQGNFRCAMCQEEIKPSNWKVHAMKKHYNITWVIGQTPIDLKNPYAVEKYLKDYRQTTNILKCHTCGATRASYAGFYAHIITCGKTEEETEMFKSVCEICNNKYLCIYKNQHMMIHRVQDYSKELKLKKAESIKKIEEEVIVSGKRRAAQKARSVIENYNNNLSQHPYKCDSCGFGTDFKVELQTHVCDKSNENEFSGDDTSEADLGDSNDESPESAVDSDISMGEDEEFKKKGHERIRNSAPVPLKVARLSFKVKKPLTYLLESDQDFSREYLTDDTLFPQWLTCERQLISDDNELSKYLPSMEVSCKVKSGFNWTTLQRFEVKEGDGHVIFTGGCIVCVAWAPARAGAGDFLAAACHGGPDSPRYQCDDTPRHENLIQIWDFGTCKELPKIAYGVAHDLGAVWSMDWCPSGARDVLSQDLEDGKVCRLGLLAVACSSGSAFIFSVPYPGTVVKDDNFVQKIKPVAELRMTMGSDRKLYQATSVTWSKQKGHEIVLVGYGDGSLAYYDLNCASPLLKTVEDNVEVFYPYYDERPHNSCIMGTDMFPLAGVGGAGGAGAACSAGATGAELAAGAARVRSQLAAHAAAFAPHWPGAMLAGDVTVMNTAMNELEWTSPARRLGGVRALAGCARCGLLATATPPALRVLRAHPAYSEYKKQIVGTLEMTPLGRTKKKQVNDELGMKLEPLTYADAITKYGIEFRSIKKADKQAQHQAGAKPRTHCPERFPLADVTSMAFCPSGKHHDMLAIATHSGLIFFMKVDS